MCVSLSVTSSAVICTYLVLSCLEIFNTGVDAQGDQSGSVLDFNAEGVICNFTHAILGLQNCIDAYACPHKGPNKFHAGRRDAHRLACEGAWPGGFNSELST